MNTKIATCCYCGKRAALVLSGKKRHELACQSCGAPLSQMKMLRSDHAHDTHLAGPAKRRKPPKAERAPKPKKRKDRRRRKGFFSRAFEEVFEEIVDAVEDVFD